jgi:hypothetical protein
MKLSISKLLKDQFYEGAFFRSDVFVKVLALEEEYEIYRKMYKSLYPKRKEEEIEERLESLLQLNALYKQEIFKLKKYPIEITKKGWVWDGAHRLAVAMFNGEKSVSVRIAGKFRCHPNHTMSRYVDFFEKEEYEKLNNCMAKYFIKYEVFK